MSKERIYPVMLITTMEDIKLPPLSLNDIDKLDQLLFFMKENKADYINIYTFCKTKWGDNKLLYLFFAEYLKKNSFASVQNRKSGHEYAWKQRILPSGLAFESFRKEYLRQDKKKKKKVSDESPNPLNNLAGMARKMFFVISLSISFLYMAYLFHKNSKSLAMHKQEEQVAGNLCQDTHAHTGKTTMYPPFIKTYRGK